MEEVAHQNKQFDKFCFQRERHLPITHFHLQGNQYDLFDGIKQINVFEKISNNHASDNNQSLKKKSNFTSTSNKSKATPDTHTIQKPATTIPDQLVFSTSQQLQTQNQSFLKPEGLPNVGNTCFLNSILQLLYGATDVKAFLIQKYKLFKKRNRTQKFQTPLFLIGELFQFLDSKQGSIIEKTKPILKLLMAKLEKLNSRYTNFSQEDVIETLTSLIESISQHFQYFKDYFLVEEEVKCQCLREGIITSKILLSEVEICSICHYALEKKYLKYPNYLLIVNQNELQPKLSLNHFQYRLIGCTVYIGNGHFGHYISYRIEDELFYELNDERVTNKYGHLKRVKDKIEALNQEFNSIRKLRLSLYRLIPQNENSDQNNSSCMSISEEKEEPQKQISVDTLKEVFNTVILNTRPRNYNRNSFIFQLSFFIKKFRKRERKQQEIQNESKYQFYDNLTKKKQPYQQIPTYIAFVDGTQRIWGVKFERAITKFKSNILVFHSLMLKNLKPIQNKPFFEAYPVWNYWLKNLWNLSFKIVH